MKNIFLFVFLSACSLSDVNQNYVQTTKAEFSGGVFKNEVWKESIIFERVSWYRELSMVFDFFIYELKAESKFYQWLSASEKDLARQCQKFYVGMSYSRRRFNRALITQSQLKNELAQLNLVHYPLIEFTRHLRSHADYLRWTAGYYRIGGYCLTDKDTKSIELSFPGFSSQTITL